METLKTVYCVVDRKMQDFSVETDHNGEHVLTCTECGHFEKFPMGEDIDIAIAAHDEANKPAPIK